MSALGSYEQQTDFSNLVRNVILPCACLIRLIDVGKAHHDP